MPGMLPDIWEKNKKNTGVAHTAPLFLPCGQWHNESAKKKGAQGSPSSTLLRHGLKDFFI